MSLLLAHNEETVHKVCSSSACEILPVCMQVKKLLIISRFALHDIINFASISIYLPLTLWRSG